MLVFTLIVSTVSTGQVRRWSALSRGEAARRAERFAPAGRRDRGHRVEVVRRNLRDLTGAELHEALRGLSEGELDAVLAELEDG